jgi:hypothetical protein
MKQIEVSKWYLPPKPWAGPRAQPYLSSWVMSADDAAKHSAIRPEPSTRTLIQVPETPEEEAQLRRAGDTSHLGGPAPGIGDVNPGAESTSEGDRAFRLSSAKRP